MMRSDFCVFILSHGRADNVVTAATLKRSGYSGKVYFVVDNQDGQVDRYRANFGADNVLVFDKERQWRECDPMDNHHRMGVILYARNACFELARQVGVKYFLELDDDYTAFQFRWQVGDKLHALRMPDLDTVFGVFLDFLEDTDADSVAMAQGGDFTGGIHSNAAIYPLMRKAMNTFFCRADRPMHFSGSINEDVNMYTAAGMRGRLIYTVSSAGIVQKTTQANSGGMTGTYLDGGTYLKSFYSVMGQPSCVRIGMLHGGTTSKESHWRVHHHIDWRHCAVKVISERWRK